MEMRLIKSRSNSKATGAAMLYPVSVTVSSADTSLSFDTDESYTLSTSKEGAKLEATSVFGALRGIETFRQLVKRHLFSVDVNCSVSISDSPRFAVRGLLIDTARHFLPISLILENLDLMEMNKLNVLHWHVVDDQSFPFESDFAEHLSEGAFSPSLRFSKENVKKVIDEAYVRGIIVMPEFDTPGHTLSWGKGYPSLLTSCSDGSFGPFNPLNEDLYPFMQGFLQEVVDTFPTSYIHLGGDEVSFDCWESNDNITAWMKQQGWTNYAKLEGYYVQKIVDIVEKTLKHKYLVWQEVFNNNITLSSDAVVDVWKGTDWATLSAVTEKGYKAVFSGGYYLDHLNTSPDFFDGWEFYATDPQGFNGTQAQKDLVIGGKAAMWGEHVDVTNFIPRVWPRTSCVGERLWSAADVTDQADAEVRLHEFRCGQVAMGFNVEPLGPGSFCDIAGYA
uniref:beta-N-acetylhexosaminidase n=1 Tax=Palpitomonas bilix TaxID=652834 RepID=A0A7S3LVZ5_9EUKA